MIYDILPIILIIVSLAIVVFILIRKLPDVASVDVKKIPRERQSDVKKGLLEKKVDRKLSGLEDKLKPITSKASGFLGGQFRKIKSRVEELEDRYKEEKKKSDKEDTGESKDKVALLLEEARSLAGEGKFPLAEKKYLEVVGLDEHNILAYAGLGEIYYKEKELEGAKESMEYVLKLADNGYGELEAGDFLLLGLIYKDLKDYKKALGSIKKAIKLEPNNPKNLDLLCKISIISKNKQEALNACTRLEKVNPGNERVREYRAEIKAL